MARLPGLANTVEGLTRDLLFPADPCDETSVDPDFVEEYQLAQEIGLNCHLLSDEWQYDGLPRTLRRNVTATSQPLVIRGWIMSLAEYQKLESLLQRFSWTLLNSSTDYQQAQFMSGWYPHIRSHSAKSVAYDLDPDSSALNSVKALEDLCAQIQRDWHGPIVIRDNLKSCKESWAEACFIYDPKDSLALSKSLKRFIELRDIALSGPLFVREFIELATVAQDYTEVQNSNSIGDNNQGSWPVSREWRLFKVGTNVTEAASLHSQMKGSPELQHLLPLIASHPSDFLAFDVVQSQSGRYFILELGDGQVTSFYNLEQARTVFQWLSEGY